MGLVHKHLLVQAKVNGLSEQVKFKQDAINEGNLKRLKEDYPKSRIAIRAYLNENRPVIDITIKGVDLPSSKEGRA